MFFEVKVLFLRNIESYSLRLLVAHKCYGLYSHHLSATSNLIRASCYRIYMRNNHINVIIYELKSILTRPLSHGKYIRIPPVFSCYHEQMVKTLILIHNGSHNRRNSKLGFFSDTEAYLTHLAGINWSSSMLVRPLFYQ